jgi:hypothetical protein
MNTTAEKRMYVGTDARLHKFGAFPTKYTKEVLRERVQAYAEVALPAAAYAVQLVQEVKQSVKWGVIDEKQARHYCKQMGLPVPLFASDYATIAALAEVGKK